MSLRAEDEHPIPEETRRVAQAAFPKGTLAMRLADQLGAIYEDKEFATLFPPRGQPALSPGRLALVTVLQFVEGPSDRQAADAVRGRIAWKYALGLELSDPGFDHTVLSEFRTRLVAGGAGLLLLDTLLARSRELGLLKRRGRQRTDSTHVLAAVRTLNRLERVGETLRAALNELAAVAPDRLRALAPAAWYERYGERVENYDLPKSETERQELALIIGADGRQLLQALATAERPEFAALPAGQILRQVWEEQDIETAGQVAMRTLEAMPSPAGLIASLYDPQARYSIKRGMALRWLRHRLLRRRIAARWVGYKVRLTETCDPDLPSLIVNVATTPATTPDDNMLAAVHASLAKRDLRRSGSTGSSGWSPARPASAASPGCPAPTRRMAWCSRPASPARTARLARCASTAPEPSASRGSSACRRASLMRRGRPLGSGRRHRRSAPTMRRGPGSRPPMSRRSAAAACVRRAISALPRPICSTS